MNRRSRTSLFSALLVAVALLAGACGASEVVVTQSALEEPTSGPAALVPEVDESAAPETEPVDEFADEPQAEAEAEQDPPQQVDEPEPQETEPRASTSLAGAALLKQATSNVDEGSFRFEVFFSMAFGDGTFETDFAPDEPISTGEVSGDLQYTRTDFGPLFDEAFSRVGDLAVVEEMFGGDLTIEVVVDGTTMYLRAPMFASMADGLAGVGLPAGLGELGDGWGVVDVGLIPGFDAADVAGLAGGQSGSSLAQMMALLEAADSEVQDLGLATVRGVETTRLGVEVNILAMLAAQGLDTDALGGLDADLLDFTLPLEVFIDAEQRLRRVSMALSLEDIGALMADEDLPAGGDFEISTTVDLFDYGADITIDIPADSEIVRDFTEVFAGLATAGS